MCQHHLIMGQGQNGMHQAQIAIMTLGILQHHLIMDQGQRGTHQAQTTFMTLGMCQHHLILTVMIARRREAHALSVVALVCSV